VVELVGQGAPHIGDDDLVVFPEYMLHGLSMNTDPEICAPWTDRRCGAQAGLRRQWTSGLLFNHGAETPAGTLFNTGLIIRPQGEVQLYYRKMASWVPVEPLGARRCGIPVCTGPKGAKEDSADHPARTGCPEMSRSGRYKGRGRDYDRYRG